MRNCAHAIKHENEYDEAWYELVQWPIEHDCAPSATSHLARIFTERCYSAVEADPTKSIFQIYKDIRTEMGQLVDISSILPQELVQVIYL